MKSITQKSSSVAALPSVLTLGDYAYQILNDQYHSIVKQERKVLADQDPEDLHKMRVGTRRLRTALQIFDIAVKVPKQGSERQVGKIAKTLGFLRDLDVQIADLQTYYRPVLAGDELDLLDEAIATLQKKRQSAFADVAATLKPDTAKAPYKTLKATYESWLEQPDYTARAQLPLVPLLPDLLSPLLADLLLHPGWLIPSTYSTEKESKILHDLRKAFKQVRYQAEFFLPFYGKPFQHWIKEVKTLQAQLGKLQDSHVLATLLAKHLPKHTELPTVQAQIQQTRAEALANWDEIRQRYLEPLFRHQLHQMMLEPVQTMTAVSDAVTPPTDQPSGSEPAAPEPAAPKASASKGSQRKKTIRRDRAT